MQTKHLCVLIHIWTKGEVGAPWNQFKPSSKIFYWQFQGGTSFVDHLCYLCLVFVMLSHLFIAALWSPQGKRLTPWLLFAMFIVILLLSYLVSWDRCGAWLYRFLVLAVFLTFIVEAILLNLLKLRLTAPIKLYDLRIFTGINHLIIGRTDAQSLLHTCTLDMSVNLKYSD